MTKQGYHIVRIGFPGEKLSKPYKIVFKNKPPVLRVENLPLETDPDGRIIKGKAASEFQIPGETISVELVYFHEGASQEINVPVSTIVDDKTGICYFEFETAIRGLPKIPADDPRYAEPFFGFKITDQAKNYYYQEQSYAQYMAPGANRFGFNNLAMINVEKLTEDEELKNIIRLTPMKSPLQHLTDGRPAIRIEVTGSTKTSRFVKIRSNVKDRLPMTLVLRDEKQLGMTTTDEYVDKEKLDAEKAEYRVEQEGADGAKYSSNTVSVSDSETTVAGIYRLRSKPKTLSDDDVKAMLKNHNFYDRDWNNSGNFKNSFMNNEDGTVTDTVTGLMWQKSGSDAYITYDKAQAYIDDLNNRKFADYNDWRLPTLEELASLLENKEVDGLYIDLKFDRKQKWCWTADKRASGGAWIVYFSYGDVNWRNLVLNDYVRGVRSRTM
ncbi:MAG: DUF1566 domain-containing protein [Desulfobacteraceae bacterium]|nr:DUF1566 domain-containing protein [Desulfobacteraceae bacterium]